MELRTVLWASRAVLLLLLSLSLLLPWHIFYPSHVSGGVGPDNHLVVGERDGQVHRGYDHGGVWLLAIPSTGVVQLALERRLRKSSRRKRAGWSLTSHAVFVFLWLFIPDAGHGCGRVEVLPGEQAAMTLVLAYLAVALVAMLVDVARRQVDHTGVA